jgi:hypothetical protein
MKTKTVILKSCRVVGNKIFTGVEMVELNSSIINICTDEEEFIGGDLLCKIKFHEASNNPRLDSVYVLCTIAQAEWNIEYCQRVVEELKVGCGEGVDDTKKKIGIS